MPTYVVLLRYTQQGIEKIKDSPARHQANKQAFAAMGAKIVGSYWVMGRYDAVAIVEAPDDETMSKVILGLGAKGVARTETLRAYTEDEFRKIVTSLP